MMRAAPGGRPGFDASTVAMAGKVCLVTGATGGMGRVIAAELARAGATVVVVARTARSGADLQRAVGDELAEDGAGRVEVLVGDLARQDDVRRVAAEFLAVHGALHILVNNAGAHFRHRELSPDGIEMHLAVNHLAGFLLSSLLLPALVAGAPSRIVNVVSETMADARGVKLRRRPRPVTISADNLNSEQDFSPMVAYGRSKLATLMCGYVLAERVVDQGVTVNAVHPGLVSTGIIAAVAPVFAQPFLGLIRPFLLTPFEGADAALRLALDPALTDTTGRYFNRHNLRPSPPTSYDHALQQQIWAASCDLVGLSPRRSRRLPCESEPSPAAARPTGRERKTVADAGGRQNISSQSAGRVPPRNRRP